MLNIRKLQIFIISALFLFNGCDDYCEFTDYENYLPLKIGNYWYYGEPEFKREVVGMNKIDGNTYYEILQKSESGNDFSFSRYYRFDDSLLWVKTHIDSTEHRLADFSLKVGDTFKQVSTGYVVTVVSDNPNKFELFYDHPDWVDEEHNIIFGVDKGITKECSVWGICFNLIAYNIY